MQDDKRRTLFCRLPRAYLVWTTFVLWSAEASAAPPQGAAQAVQTQRAKERPRASSLTCPALNRPRGLDRASNHVARYVKAKQSSLGFNVDPRWLQGKPMHQLIRPLTVAGLNMLEFPADTRSPAWPKITQMVKVAVHQGIRPVFHLPYKEPYNLAGFASGHREEVTRLYAPSLAYASKIAQKLGKPITVVVHGASGTADRATLERDTTAFLNWAVARFPGVKPAFELLPPAVEPGRTKVGDSKAELVKLISTRCPKGVGICWDMGHDVLGGGEPVPKGFLPEVTHVHLHDIAPNSADHSPLRYGRVPWRRDLGQLLGAGFHGTVTLELKGERVSRTAKQLHEEPLKVLKEDVRAVHEKLERPRS